MMMTGKKEVKTNKQKSSSCFLYFEFQYPEKRENASIRDVIYLFILRKACILKSKNIATELSAGEFPASYLRMWTIIILPKQK